MNWEKIKCTHCSNKFNSKETIKHSEIEKFISCTKALNFYVCPVCDKVLIVEEALIKYDMAFSEKTTKITFLTKKAINLKIVMLLS